MTVPDVFDALDETLPRPVASSPAAWAADRARLLSARVADGARAHRRSLALLAVLLPIVAVVHGVNFDGWPGRVTDDEGTYAAQAYSMQYWNRIAHYTYWYDHPFGGWLLIAIYTKLTDGFHRAATAVTAARELMFLLHLVSCVLLYRLGRLLGLRRFFAGLALLVFSLSPLALWYQRMAFLDNIAVMWLLAAFVCAASPRRSVAAAALAGTFMAFSFWSKETTLLFLPGLYVLLWQHRDSRNWRFVRRNFLGCLLGICGIYILYAAAKNELFEGPGHVSLEWAVRWQLFDRAPSGSVLDTGSDTYNVVRSWLDLDPYLVLAGIAAAVPLLALRRLRVVSALLLLQFGFIFRNGYLPNPYVTAMLPFAALCAAGLLDAALPRTPLRVAGADGERDGDGGARGVPGWLTAVWTGLRRGAVAVAVVGSVVTLAWDWTPKIHTALTVDASAPSRDATRWFLAHIHDNGTVITDDIAWTDLVVAGRRPLPVWFYKLDLDPEVRGHFPHGWKDVDYLMMGKPPDSVLAEVPIVAEALHHSVVLKSFGNGEIEIRRVLPPGCRPDIPPAHCGPDASQRLSPSAGAGDYNSDHGYAPVGGGQGPVVRVGDPGSGAARPGDGDAQRPAGGSGRLGGGVGESARDSGDPLRRRDGVLSPGGP
ncbi:Dolichyl-phosphate-mannose-protein mannosyltransferase [Frankia torreyi]|uniref:Dolichyl-phosphate-mannose-protein mannosyltransferase n=1 Tax=Frankia torreyi TaxID=1856 RepID=A0A0D8BIM5_9ACTN|nr:MULTISPECIES: 4-amino-4-deoxy-L-arabinose transferase [Frankia]KJE23925.1 Dolichyl-phosphate-mannose-protein mannosyltransferase [Frankia torreyi]